MRELSERELALVAGGGQSSVDADFVDPAIPDYDQDVGNEFSGYEGAGAILTVLGAGAAIVAAPLSPIVGGIAIGSAAGLAIAQYMADHP